MFRSCSICNPLLRSIDNKTVRDVEELKKVNGIVEMAKMDVQPLISLIEHNLDAASREQMLCIHQNILQQVKVREKQCREQLDRPLPQPEPLHTYRTSCARIIGAIGASLGCADPFTLPVQYYLPWPLGASLLLCSNAPASKPGRPPPPKIHRSQSQPNSTFTRVVQPDRGVINGGQAGGQPVLRRRLSSEGSSDSGSSHSLRRLSSPRGSRGMCGCGRLCGLAG
jgi:hypothetical protein